MTPPDANIEKQKRRHRPVLLLLLAAVAAFTAGSLIVLWGPAAPEPDAVVAPRTGDG